MSNVVDLALTTTKRAQHLASEPDTSAWVSANAGAGKTHVLKMRVLKLLLAGTAPDRILCLTFTKTAAAEMAQRVFDELSKWATCSDEDLVNTLTELLDRGPTADELRRARQLFARAVETPGGLKVQTIHAFCERILQRFPLEAGIPPGFTVLDEEAASELLRQSIDDVLVAATAPDAGALGDALRTVIAYAADDGFDKALQDALGKREWLNALSRLGARTGDAFQDAAEIYRVALGVTTPDLATVEARLVSVLSDDELRRAVDVLSGGSKSDASCADLLRPALTKADPKLRFEDLKSYFLTSSGTPRTRLMTKALQDRDPGLYATLTNAQNEFVRLCEERVAHTLINATLALWRLADAVSQCYAEAKARRAALDFDDLIARTESLLRQSDWTQWVLYKLDNGLEHILVDEAQDTSPSQWAIVKSLAAEFFAGRGAHEVQRTVFAVGDEKQSIYSFQGAAPKLFAETGQLFAERARAARLKWETVPLTLSFRSTAAVLESVDRVFADPTRTPGLSAAAAKVRHQARRIGHAGLVEIWPTEVWLENQPAEAWSPLDDQVTQSPVVRLANRIADTIKDWLDTGERLESENRPIRPGDILILVRRRKPFAAPMVAALKARGIPVAGSDRMQLTEQLAVEDMIALGEFVILPEDDLALASVLKSPLFGLTDEDLLSFAPNRNGSLWSALLAAAKENPRLEPAASTLRRWRAEADYRPPYEFFANILENEGMRTRMLARLGPEAAEPLDEFLNLALQYDERHPPSLQGFLVWLRKLRLEIKRDQEHGRDEVRVMTVHGAKGLEAPIVFLPDTCSVHSGRQPNALVRLVGVPTPVGYGDFYVWPVKETGGHPAVRTGRQAVATEEAEERNRLLYVAMTRARDRLYVAGFETKKGRGNGCWYDLIKDALREICEEIPAPDGRTILRYAHPQTAPPEEPRNATAGPPKPEPLPEWALRKAPREPAITFPLAPSRLTPPQADEIGDPVVSGAVGLGKSEISPSPLALSSDYRFLRGTLTHALLEHLPNVPQPRWRDAAQQFVELRGQALPAEARAALVEEVLAILTDPQFSALFGPDSRAEVPIAAAIPDPTGRRPELRITGQIDRLVRLPDAVLLLDYKTNRPPPQQPQDVPAAYLMQLAAYRLVLREVFPELPVRAAILWTDGARLMPIPSDLLDIHEEMLWRRDSVQLDA